MNKPKKKMNKWLVAMIIGLIVVGGLFLYVRKIAKQGMRDLDNMMAAMSDVDLAQICLQAETDPKVKASMEKLKHSTPEVDAMLKKMSPGISKYNRRQLKMCASDYKAVLANKAKK